MPIPPVRLAAARIAIAGAGVTWYTACALGPTRAFNDPVAYGVGIGLWLGGIVVTSLGAFLLWPDLRRKAAAFRAAAGPGRVDEVAAPGRS